MCWISNNIWRAVPSTSSPTTHPTPRGGHGVREVLAPGCVCLRLTVWIFVYVGVSLMVWSVFLAKCTQAQPHKSQNECFPLGHSHLAFHKALL